ncbi:Ppx/GppA phosphatase family protein [Umezawaea tangerina]|uniref:Exopolyphosphatase/guanosine-5'-triphosphate, 3'-diphosphate pyrophosphatase n=1 Tax=Umezawaea tangerina TaxID=84725 RepID=A0A2T0SV35_9PSEU|nr:exopolyphosphatase [Umezawaea tangerina]PRY37260.1 exopolyphosphatase/guanosine-5'-triphosphate,3'-diphosphate pyrophosphatase [Umezawaea tangerina]
MSGRPERVGVLDVGCFSAQLVVVDRARGSLLHPEVSHKVRLRMDRALDERGRITKAGVDELVSAVRQARRLADRAEVTTLVPFATSVIRDAANGADVMEQVATRSGVGLGVLSGPEEARLSFLAARRWFGWSAGPLVVMDVGGGTVEIAAGEAETPDFARSLPIGARTLTREWLDDVAASPRRLRDLRSHLTKRIDDVLPAEVTGRAVGCSKVFEQLARLAGARPQRDGLSVPRRLTIDDLRACIPRLASRSARQRARLPGISAHRARQSLAGAVVAEALMSTAGRDVVEICPWSTREGLLLSLIERPDRVDHQIRVA